MTQQNDIDLTVERLYSTDANDRVKAAGELGEIGTPDIAPKLLKVTYEDEASTVRQMAIQSYSEILGEDSLDDVIKAADQHFDEYVKLYAVMILGRIGGPKVGKPLIDHIQSFDSKIQAAALKAMIHAETKENGNHVFQVLKDATVPIVIRNCIEALTLWKYKDAEEYVKEHYFDNNDVKDIELKTISALYLAVLGEKSGKKYLENEKIDKYLRISVDDTYYKGRDGLIEVLNKI